MQWLQFLIPAVLVLGPVIGQIIKKLNEVSEQKRIEQDRVRLREEVLRTGRAPIENAPTSPNDPRQARPEPARPQGGAAARSNLEEIARRRKAELLELQRRQQAGQARPQVRAQPTTTRPQPQPRPVPQVQPRPQPRPQTRPQPTRPQPARPQARPQPTRPQTRPKPVSRRIQVQDAPQPTARPLSTPTAKRASPPRKLASLGQVSSIESKRGGQSGVTVPRDLESWRQAIVLTEILSPPVSMRGERF